MPADRIRPPFPYYGGKQLAARRIIALLLPHAHYVEPYAGSLAVLLAMPRATFETVNDLDGRLVSLWRVLRERPGDLARACAMTPHASPEHAAALDAVGDEPDDDLERAWSRRQPGTPNFVPPGRMPQAS